MAQTGRVGKAMAIEEYEISPLEEGMAAYMHKQPADSNPYRFGNTEAKYYEWALGWYKNAYELDQMSRKMYGKPFWDIDKPFSEL